MGSIIVYCILRSKLFCDINNFIKTNTIKMNVDTSSLMVNSIITSDTSVCVGDSVMIELLSQGCAPINYVWYENGVVIPENNSNKLYIKNLNEPGIRKYNCMITNLTDTSYSEEIMLYVNKIPSGLVNVYNTDNNIVIVNTQNDADSSATFEWDFSGGTVISGSNSIDHEVLYSDGGYRRIKLLITQDNCISEPIYSGYFKPTLFDKFCENLPTTEYGNVVLVDYNNDGFKDIFITGSGKSKLFKNINSDSFLLVNSSFIPLSNSHSTWADFNNDGNLDLALIGFDGASNRTLIYENVSNDSFTLVTELSPGLKNGSISHLDYNNDGWLDLLISGEMNDTSAYTGLFKNKKEFIFDTVNNSFLPLKNSYASVGDYNKDGYVDFIIQGKNVNGRFTKVYKNNKGVYSDIGNQFIGLDDGACAWGDIDNDGKLDVVISGLKSDPIITSNSADLRNSATIKIYKNIDNDQFISINANGLAGYCTSDLKLIDYDNDGDLDLLITGDPGVMGVAIGINGGNTSYNYHRSGPILFRNDGGANFSDIQADIPRCFTNNFNYCLFTSYFSSSISIGDFNNDWKTDFIIEGNGSEHVNTRLYKNLTVNNNTPPSPPTGLLANVSCNSAILKWNDSYDDHTPTVSLNYQISISDNDSFPNIASFKNYNISNINTFNINNLKPGKYFWKVKSIDGANIESEFSETSSFTIPVFYDSITLYSCMGDSIYFKNNWFYHDSIITDTNSCMNIVKTKLLFHPIFYNHQDFYICKDERFTNNTPGIYIDSLKSKYGCDSLIIKNYLVAASSFSLGQDTSINIADSIVFVLSSGMSKLWFNNDTSSSIIIKGEQLNEDSLLVWVLIYDSNSCFSSDSVWLSLNKITKSYQIKNINEINIWPNPAKDYIMVSMPNIKCKNIELMNSTGLIIVSLDNIPTTRDFKIPLGKVSSGLYLLRFLMENESIVIKPLIIRN